MEDEDGYMALDRRCKRDAAERPGPLRDAGPATRDPEPGFAPRWIRTPMRSPRCLLGALVAVLLLSFAICGSLSPSVLAAGGEAPGGCGVRERVAGTKFCHPGLHPPGAEDELVPPRRRWGLRAVSCGVDAAQEEVFLGHQQEQLLEGEPGGENCSHQRAQLLVPEDQGELDFLNRVIQKPTRYFWIGLSQPSVGMAWTWLDGSRLDQSRFNLSTPNASGACGALREDRIISETCGSALAWICQKEAVLL
ncbi:Killer cell lectin-like receptor subfamily F member 1 [Anas platyrhynchos]|uniref:Killer cell lectin-like receptor subfamily F member 1 n=1 Tax=Anas platyrhynchos TaxID=8839 RepID=R0KWC6_ANAPL|nr:Killer cell lectin-like receptor subfamily F member 1 [Anas platyrhynchos]